MSVAIQSTPPGQRVPSTRCRRTMIGPGFPFDLFMMALLLILLAGVIATSIVGVR